MANRADLLAYRDAFAEHAHVRSRLIRGNLDQPPPLVSILIPTFRRPQLLREAVDSALKQKTDVTFEVVVVDNDAESLTSDAVDKVIINANSPRVFLYRNEQNIGMFGNWNRCIELARGNWITILNDDDLLGPDFLAASLAVVARRPEIRLLACEVTTLNQQAATLPPRPLIRRLGRFIGRLLKQSASDRPDALRLEDYFLSNPHSGSLGILMQREAAFALGGFSPALYPSADFAFFVRYQIAYGAFRMRRCLATYRIGVNESLNPELLRGWLQQGLQLRREIAHRIRRFPRLLEFYGRIQAIDTVRSYASSWNAHFDSKAFLRDAGLSNMPSYVLKHAVRLLLQVIFYFNHQSDPCRRRASARNT